MSRIIIKNLPSRITEGHLREQFSKCGDITDVKLMKTQRGVFRRFAFVGYSTEPQAATAVDHFNKTFINASKIEVEIAKPYGDHCLERPWSKYSKGSSAFDKLDNEEKKEVKPVPPRDDKASYAKAVGEGMDEDEGFQEFLNAHKHSGSVWADGAANTKVKGRPVEGTKETSSNSEEVNNYYTNASV